MTQNAGGNWGGNKVPPPSLWNPVVVATWAGSLAQVYTCILI